MKSTFPLKIGIIADCQYDGTGAEPNATGTRYVVSALQKLKDAVAELNKYDLDFVVNLGDLIDKEIENFDAATKVLSALKVPLYHLVGNHDFCGPDYEYAVCPREDIFAALGMQKPYDSWQHKGWTFISLDTNELGIMEWPPGSAEHENGAKVLLQMQQEGAKNARPFNGGLSDAQFEWLENQLQSAPGPVLVFGHHPIYPEHATNCLTDKRLRELLQKTRAVQAYFCGHEHSGNFSMFKDLPCLTFKGMVETKDENCFSIVNLTDEAIEINGFGREDSRVLER